MYNEEIEWENRNLSILYRQCDDSADRDQNFQICNKTTVLRFCRSVGRGDGSISLRLRTDKCAPLSIRNHVCSSRSEGEYAWTAYDCRCVWRWRLEQYLIFCNFYYSCSVCQARGFDASKSSYQRNSIKPNDSVRCTSFTAFCEHGSIRFNREDKTLFLHLGLFEHFRSWELFDRTLL